MERHDSKILRYQTVILFERKVEAPEMPIPVVGLRAASALFIEQRNDQ